MMSQTFGACTRKERGDQLINEGIVNDILDRYDLHVENARKMGIIPSQHDNPELYEKGIQRINNYMTEYTDQTYTKVLYTENEKKAVADYFEEVKKNEPDWLKEVVATKKPGQTDLTTYKEGSGSFYDYNPEKKTVKVKLYRGAAEGKEVDSVSYWTTNKSYAESYVKKAGENGKLYSTVAELPVYEASGSVYIDSNGVYTEGSTSNISKKYGQEGSKLVAPTNLNGAEHSVHIKVPFGVEANDRLTTRHFMLGEDYVKGNIQTIEPSFKVPEAKPDIKKESPKKTVEQNKKLNPQSTQQEESAKSTATSSTINPEQKLSNLQKELVNATKGINANSTPEEIKRAQAAVESIEGKIASVQKEIESIRNSSKTKPIKATTTDELINAAKQLESATKEGPLLLEAPKPTRKELAQEKLRKAAQGQPSSGPVIELPHIEDPLDKNLSTIKGQPTPIKTNDQIKEYIQKNRWKGAGIGLGVSIVKSIFDDEEGDIFTDTGNAVKTGAAVLGASYLAEAGLDYASSKDYQVASMWAKTTVQDYVKEQVTDSAQKMKEVANSAQNIKEAADTEKMIAVGGKIGTTAKIGAGIIGVASIIDIGQRLQDSHEAKRIKKEQEKDLKRKKKLQDERNKEQSYGYIQDGEILFELFGERTGHHKMGNAKFM